jgi:hypothetical protein
MIFLLAFVAFGICKLPAFCSPFAHVLISNLAMLVTVVKQ